MRLTKRFMDWYQGNNDKEKETPKGGVKRVGYVLWNYAGRLVGANVLFLLCCIPIVTIPAALSALNRYLSAIYRVGYGFSLEDYWKEFKSDILKNLPAGVLSQAEPVLLSRKLWDDDRIIMMTDGVLEACPGLEKEATLKEYLESMPVKTPQDMAERILRFACQNGGMNDDMTVLVAGIWKR